MAVLSRVARLVILLSACAGPALAQAAAAAAPVSPEKEKAELYGRLLRMSGPAARQQAMVYETVQEYLRKYGEPEDDIVRHMKAWLARYEAAVRGFESRRVAEALAAQEAEAKAELYSRRRQRAAQTPQEKRAAYELGKEFLRRHGGRKYGDANDEIIAYVSRWVAKYEAEIEARRLSRQLMSDAPAGARPACRRTAERGFE